MIAFEFEVKLVLGVSAATATAAYKKLVESLPTTNVTELQIVVRKQEELQEKPEVERKA